MRFSECKRRIRILRNHGFTRLEIGERDGFIKFLKVDGVHGGMIMDWSEVTDERIVYFEEYVKNVVKHREKQIKEDFVRRSLYGMGGLDD